MSMGTAIPMAMQLGSSALKAYGAQQEGKFAASSYRDAARAQAGIAQHNARQVGSEASVREDLVRRQGREAIGAQAAAMAQAGIAGSGTALNVADQSLVNAELDALNIRYDGTTKREAILNEAQNSLIAGENKAMQVKHAGRIGALGALTQGFMGAYGMASQDLAEQKKLKDSEKKATQETSATKVSSGSTWWPDNSPH